MTQHPTRRLAAILAADVAGYSRLVGADEEGTIEALRQLRSDVIEPLIQRFGGRIANTAGDSFLIEFRSAVDAVRAAIEIQSEMRKRNADKSEDRAIVLRIGINVGDVVSNGDDILGDGVNVAARLEALAQPGGIVASQSVVEYVRSKVGAGFLPMGPQRVKNIVEPVDAFRVDISGAGQTTHVRRSRFPLVAAVAAVVLLAGIAFGAFWFRSQERDLPQASEQQAAHPLPDLPSVAVLPLSDFSGGEGNSLLADGLTEDLITDLSRISGLFVIAGNTSFAYRNQDISVAEFAEELGVRYVIDGSLRRTGSDMRINIRLTDAATGQLLWAERFDGQLEDIFDVQGRFVLAIAQALDLTLEAGQRVQIERAETHTIAAREAFQKGWELYARFSERDNFAAIPHFEQAVSLDPDYGRAWAALALAHFRPHIFHHWNAVHRESGQLHIGYFYDSLREASKFETSLVHVVRAMMNLNFRERFNVGETQGIEEARQEAAKAIALQPSDPEAHVTMGWALIAAGEPHEGLSFVEAAMRLNPKYPSHYVLFQSAAHFALGELETASDLLLSELQRNPQAKELMPFAASVLALSGDRRTARSMVDRWRAGENEGALDEAVDEYFFVVRWVSDSELNLRLSDGLRLAALPPGTTIDSLRAELKLGDSGRQLDAARALSLFGPQAAPAVPELIATLESPSALIRKSAAIALGRIGAAASSAIPALEASSDGTLAGRFSLRAIERIRGDLAQGQ